MFPALLVTTFRKLDFKKKIHPFFAHLPPSLFRIQCTGFGVPMHRRRVFIVASLHGDPRDVLLSQTNRCAGECAFVGFGKNLAKNLEETQPDADADAEPQKHAHALCYECFHNDPSPGDPVSVAACVDFTEKRRPPLLHELESLTPRNARRLCVVREELCKSGRAAAGMLSATDVEKLMGFPYEWTEPCARASRAHTPEEFHEQDVRGGRRGSPPNETTPVLEGTAAEQPVSKLDADAPEPRALKNSNGEDGGIRTPTEIAEGDRVRRERVGDANLNESFVVGAPGSDNSDVDNPFTSVAGENEHDTHDESSDDDLANITAQEAHDIVRIMLMASATAVPQARWIGERLLDPYGTPFQRHKLGIPFAKEVVGGLDDADGRAWAEAGWNVAVTRGKENTETWRGRHALRECGDAPRNDPFVPLGSFLNTHGDPPSEKAAAKYVTQLQIAHADIPGFVMDALDPYGEASAGDTAHWAGDKPHAVELIALEDLADLASAEPGIVAAAKVEDVVVDTEMENGGDAKTETAREARDGAENPPPAEHSVAEITTPKEASEVGKEPEPEPEKEKEKEEPPTPEELLAEDLSGSEDEGNVDDPFMVGTPVWAPWRLGKGAESVLWPGISLCRTKDAAVIPDEALQMRQPKNATPESHHLVVFFGDRTYMWLPVSSFHDFEFRGEVFEARIAQNVKRNSATFTRACVEARAWGRTWRRLRAVEACKKRKRRESARKAREMASAAKDAEKKLAEPREAAVVTPERAAPDSNLATARESARREDTSPDNSGSPGLFGVGDFGPDGYLGSLVSGAEPEPCGTCRVCKARTPEALRNQAILSAKQRTETPGVPRHMRCPQVAAVRAARGGHHGALISLRREGAVGQRVCVLWDEDDRFYRGRVSRFDTDAFTHDVEFDDGEVSRDLRLWRESVTGVDARSDPHPFGRRFVVVTDDGDRQHTPPNASNGSGNGKKRKASKTEDTGGVWAPDTTGVGAHAKSKKRKHAAAVAVSDADASCAQRCDSCARSHKGISYCAARGHVVHGVKRLGGAGEHGAGGGAGKDGGTEIGPDGVPRVAARRGGNGKFVVSESVGAVLLGAGLDVPERCPLCIRRKKGLAHCLKKQHIWLTPERSAVLAKTPAAPKTGKAKRGREDAKDAAARTAANAVAAVAPAAAAAMLPALMQMPMPPGMPVEAAAQAQAQAAAAMAAAMMGMGAMPVPLGMAMPRPPV